MTEKYRIKEVIFEREPNQNEVSDAITEMANMGWERYGWLSKQGNGQKKERYVLLFRQPTFRKVPRKPR